MSENKDFIFKSVSESSVQSASNNKNYTIPRTFGVYEINKPNISKRFRFGNHPVRENELIREFGDIKKLGLFLHRSDAKSFSDYLNSQ